MEEKKETNATPNYVDETGFINTEEIKNIVKEEQTKKECWLKRLFKKKDKK